MIAPNLGKVQNIMIEEECLFDVASPYSINNISGPEIRFSYDSHIKIIRNIFYSREKLKMGNSNTKMQESMIKLLEKSISGISMKLKKENKGLEDEDEENEFFNDEEKIEEFKIYLLFLYLTLETKSPSQNDIIVKNFLKSLNCIHEKSRVSTAKGFSKLYLTLIGKEIELEIFSFRDIPEFANSVVLKLSENHLKTKLVLLKKRAVTGVTDMAFDFQEINENYHRIADIGCLMKNSKAKKELLTFKIISEKEFSEIIEKMELKEEEFTNVFQISYSPNVAINNISTMNSLKDHFKRILVLSQSSFLDCKAIYQQIGIKEYAEGHFDWNGGEEAALKIQSYLRSASKCKNSGTQICSNDNSCANPRNSLNDSTLSSNSAAATLFLNGKFLRHSLADQFLASHLKLALKISNIIYFYDIEIGQPQLIYRILKDSFCEDEPQIFAGVFTSTFFRISLDSSDISSVVNYQPQNSFTVFQEEEVEKEFRSCTSSNQNFFADVVFKGFQSVDSLFTANALKVSLGFYYSLFVFAGLTMSFGFSSYLVTSFDFPFSTAIWTNEFYYLIFFAYCVLLVGFLQFMLLYPNMFHSIDTRVRGNMVSRILFEFLLPRMTGSGITFGFLFAFSFNYELGYGIWDFNQFKAIFILNLLISNYINATRILNSIIVRLVAFIVLVGPLYFLFFFFKEIQIYFISTIIIVMEYYLIKFYYYVLYNIFNFSPFFYFLKKDSRDFLDIENENQYLSSVDSINLARIFKEKCIMDSALEVGCKDSKLRKKFKKFNFLLEFKDGFLRRIFWSQMLNRDFSVSLLAVTFLTLILFSFYEIFSSNCDPTLENAKLGLNITQLGILGLYSFISLRRKKLLIFGLIFIAQFIHIYSLFVANLRQIYISLGFNLVFYQFSIPYTAQLLIIVSHLAGIYAKFEIFSSDYCGNVDFAYDALAYPIIIFFLYVSISSLNAFSHQKLKINNFQNNEQNQQIKYRFQNAMALLLPHKLSPYVKNNIIYSKKEENIAIVFIDICDFDEIVEEKGVDLLSFLETAWRLFDDLTEFYGGQKIETVGKTYMAAFGLSWSDAKCNLLKGSPDHIHRSVLFADEVLQRSKAISWKQGKAFNVKIGMNNGDVLTGIIGYHKPQFSLIGDTVNTTSRMCSLAGCGGLVMSDKIYQLLASGTVQTNSRIVPVKGKGDMEVHDLVSVDALRLHHQLHGLNVIHLKNQKSSKRFKRKSLPSMDKIESLERKRVQHQNLLKEQLELSFCQGLMDKKKILYYERLLLIFRQPYFPEERKFYDYMFQEFKFADFSYFLILLFLNILHLVFTLHFEKDSTPVIIVHSLNIMNILLLGILEYKKKFGRLQLGLMVKMIAVFLAFIFEFLQFNDEILGIQVAFLIVKVEAIVKNSQVKLFQVFIVFIPYISIILIYSFCAYYYEAVGLDAITITLFLWIIFLEKRSRLMNLIDSYFYSMNLKSEREEKEYLVKNLLPSHLNTRFLENFTLDINVSEFIPNATFLFADLVKFTNYSARVKIEDVITMLSSLFSEFDRVSVTYNVYKLYTIGDCYVVMGLNSSKRDPSKEAINVLNFAFAIIDALEKVKNELGLYELQTRIGIHSGKCIAGIVGSNIVRYDIYGTDILIANKLESSSQPGKILISGETKSFIDSINPHAYKYISNEPIEIKKINRTVKTHFVERKI